VVLAKPTWVSHLVLYLNNATPDNAYATISVLANDMEAKLPTNVALVRKNTRRFVVIHFDKPVYTDVLKILPGYHPAHKENMTEIEVYGPLGGPEVSGKPKAFSEDADAMPMFMGDPTHVRAKLPSDVTGAYGEIAAAGSDAPAYFVGATIVDDLLAFGHASGSIQSYRFPKEGAKDPRFEYGRSWPLASVTPTSTPARYAGRLLVGSADKKLHAIADDGNPLWAFTTGGRVYSSPTPAGDDVIVGSDDGKLYKLDVDSGILIWEFATGDKVRASPALAKNRVFAASFDGFLYAVDAQSGLQLWKSPIAKLTRASAAVKGERVYIGDEEGGMHCFDAATGAALWKTVLKIEGYISACPVVTDEGVFFASESGAMALVGEDGAVRWKKKLAARLTGQPVATETQLLLPTNAGLQVLRRADGQADERFTTTAPGRPVLSVLKYRDALCLMEATTSTADINNRTFVTYSGVARILGPVTPGAKTPPKTARPPRERK